MLQKSTRLGMCCTLCSFFLAVIASAQVVTKTVDDGTDGTLRQEIQDTPAGGTITFAEGITTILITSELSIAKELTIAADSTARVTIDAQMNSRLFNITSGPVALNNLILMNGRIPGNGAGLMSIDTDIELNNTDVIFCEAGDFGGGLYVSGATSVVVNYGLIQSNLAYERGGGFYIQSENTVLQEVAIVANGSDKGGGGIFNSGGTLQVSECSITNNQFTFNTDVSNIGAGILNFNGDLIVKNSTISNNDSRASGGGIYSSGGTVNIEDTEISENGARFLGGGLALMNNTMVTLTNVEISGNSGSGPDNSPFSNDGAGMYAIGNGEILVNGGAIANNSAGRNGGGINMSSGKLTLNGTEFRSNSANYESNDLGGGGIYVESGELIINAGTQFIDNVADDFRSIDNFGGAILAEEASKVSFNSTSESPVVFQGNFARGRGGAIAYRSLETLNLSNINFTRNTGLYGGALHNAGVATINIDEGLFFENGESPNEFCNEGAAIWNSAGTININGTEFLNNVVTLYGGAIYNTAGTVNINDTEIMGNYNQSDVGLGGGIYNTNGGSLSIANTLLANNSTPGNGGAIADNSTVNTGTLALTNVILRNNFSTGSVSDGGALHLIGSGTVDIRSCELSENFTDNRGGAIRNDAARINIKTSTFSGNYTLGEDMTDTENGNGGAIYNSAGNVNIDASTLVFNKSQGSGGAIYNGPLAVNTTLKNTIIALNTAESGNNLAGESDFVSADYNLIGEDELGVFETMSNDQEGTVESPIDPMIDLLANNGGFTQTHALLDGSPAYNAGNPIDNFVDQRGEAIFDGRRDIGAFEAQMNLGIENIIAFTNKSTLYPNPSQGNMVTLDIPVISEGTASIAVVEIGTGKIMHVQDVNSGKNILKTDGLSSGTYLVQIKSQRNIESLKLIISY
ncbi:MAG: choice-of-anchor Q domain-containing protein [Leeuwenhoekiella sp.]